MNPEQLVINSADLLQANVTLVAGILILLTMSILTERVGYRVVVIIIATVIPFLISTALIIHATGASPDEKLLNLIIPSFLFGLLYLAITLVAIGVIVVRKYERKP